MKLEFESERFKLVVSGEKKSNTYTRTSDHYYEVEQTDVWWTGHGVVLQKATGAKAPFVFRLDVRGGWARSKDEETLAWLLNLSTLSRIDSDARIVDKPRYLDLYLGAWWEKISAANDAAGTDIPKISNGYASKISVPSCSEVDFVGMGVQLDENGQRHLPGVES